MAALLGVTTVDEDDLTAAIISEAQSQRALRRAAADGYENKALGLLTVALSGLTALIAAHPGRAWLAGAIPLALAIAMLLRVVVKEWDPAPPDLRLLVTAAGFYDAGLLVSYLRDRLIVSPVADEGLEDRRALLVAGMAVMAIGALAAIGDLIATFPVLR
jgi:hypothetical protein